MECRQTRCLSHRTTEEKPNLMDVNRISHCVWMEIYIQKVWCIDTMLHVYVMPSCYALCNMYCRFCYQLHTTIQSCPSELKSIDIGLHALQFMQGKHEKSALVEDRSYMYCMYMETETWSGGHFHLCLWFSRFIRFYWYPDMKLEDMMNATIPCEHAIILFVSTGDNQSGNFVGNFIFCFDSS